MTAAHVKPIVAGRYAVFDRIASGGMAAVHIGRLTGEAGFARTVAIKRMHPQFAEDPEFVAMFHDEARLAARIRHPNVVPTLDVVAAASELFLVMEYIEGESLATLVRLSSQRKSRVPVEIAAGILLQALRGLHAAHEAKNDLGESLGLVHRDVSPQNLLVGADGVVRVVDFGVAKALGKLHTTREGQLKGKLGYHAPEQLLGHPTTQQSDVFAAGVVLWEALTSRRLFTAESEGEVVRRIIDAVVEPPSTIASDIPPALDAIVMRGLAREPLDRFESALAMADAIDSETPFADPQMIGAWVRALAREALEERAVLVQAVESSTAYATHPAPPVASADADASTKVAVVKARSVQASPDGTSLPARASTFPRAAFVMVSIAALASLGALLFHSLPPAAGALAAEASAPTVSTAPTVPPPIATVKDDPPPVSATPAVVPVNRTPARISSPRRQVPTAPVAPPIGSGRSLYGRE